MTAQSWRPLFFVLASLACVGVAVSSAAQTAGSLTGSWVVALDGNPIRQDVGFDLIPRGRSRGDDSGTSRGGRGGGGGTDDRFDRLPMRPSGESVDDARRRQVLTGEVRTPPKRLTITDASDQVTLTDENGRSRTFHPDGRSDVLKIDGVDVLTTARREAGALIVLYAVADLRQIRYRYARSADKTLKVDVQFLERGQGDSVSIAYKSEDGSPARAANGSAVPAASLPGSPSSAAAPPSASSTGANSPAAARAPRPGNEYSGLRELGVVIEPLGAQATACGLREDALRNAVMTPFRDAGVKVAVNSDEDTYVFVTVAASRLPNGTCVSRFDWSIYSLTQATLSHQSTPTLAQVELTHKRGLLVGTPDTLAAGLLASLGDGLREVAGLIRAANR